MMALQVLHTYPLNLGQIPWPLSLSVLICTARDLRVSVSQVPSSPNTSC